MTPSPLKVISLADNPFHGDPNRYLEEIYGANQNVQKSIFYQPSMEHGGGLASIFNARDRQLHARKKRILAPAFTEVALSSMEEYILPHIRAFFETASEENSSGAEGHVWVVDVAKWANYLTFDIMAELAFGKDFGMIEGKASRELPDIIDAAVHLELIVSHRILNTPQAGF
jgi:cytochrome P450